MAKVYLKVAKSDPAKPAPKKEIAVSSGKTVIDADLDLRDKLAELAVRGNALSPDDKAAVYGALTSSLGKERAQKLMTHAYLFNSRPDMQGMSPEEKLKSFYTIGSNDPDVQEVIGRTKNLGYGILPGFRGSISDINKDVQKGVYGQNIGVVSPEVQKRVMLKIGR